MLICCRDRTRDRKERRYGTKTLKPICKICLKGFVKTSAQCLPRPICSGLFHHFTKSYQLNLSTDVTL